jgi:hypothetical protein
LRSGGRLGKRSADAVRIEIRGIDRGARLLTPGLIKRAGVDTVISQFVEEPDDPLLVSHIITRHRQRDASRCTSRLAAIEKASPVQVVDGLEHRPP